MKKIICLIVSGTLICSLLCGCNKSEQYNYPVKGDTFTIESKYCNLEYPEKWESSVSFEQENRNDKCIVSFYSEEVHLFDVSFNTEKGDYIGVAEINQEDVEVYVKTYSIEADAFSEEEYQKLCSMQEDVNVIITKLIDDYNLDAK